LSNVAEPLHLVIIVTYSTPKEYLQYLQDNHISYLMAGSTEIDFPVLFSKIKEKFGVETLLLEGGGILNGSVMATGLIDEISLLVTPTVINRSQAPSIFEHGKTGPLILKHYTLTGVRQMEKDTVWLRYKKSG
jgi:riboflavin biosynthesis pyrimidine reductase